MMLSLKKIIYAGALCLVLLLGTLLVFGVRQYQLYRTQEQISAQTEKMIFQFAIIREHVSEALVERQYNRLAGVADEMEKLNENLSGILANRHIAATYKLNLVNSIDLPGIILLVRRIEAGREEPESLRKLNRTMRTLGERLMLFDRVLVNFAKRKLIGFQNVVIGALAITVCMVICGIILFHRWFLAPLLLLTRQAREVAAGDRTAIFCRQTGREIGALAGAFSELVARSGRLNMELTRLWGTLEAVKRVRKGIGHASMVTALFQEVCRALLFNRDYCLVWIGMPASGGEDLTLASSSAVATLSSKDRDACMSILQTAAEEDGPEHNPALQALRSGVPVVNQDILKNVPSGLLEGTPLAGGRASCAAFPVGWQGRMYGVLCIYAVGSDCFGEREVELLQNMAETMAMRIYGIRLAGRLEVEQNLRTQVLEMVGGILIFLSSQGDIVAMNRVAERYSGYSSEEMAGKELGALLSCRDESLPHQGEDVEMLEGRDVEMILHGREGKRRFLCRVLKVVDDPDNKNGFFCFGREISEDAVAGQQSGAPGVGCLMGNDWVIDGVVHEISDLSNGMINYAQVMTDEIKGGGWKEEQIEIVEKIIDVGERIADFAGKLILYGRGGGQPSATYLPVLDVLNDAIWLASYSLKIDGVRLEADLTDLAPGFPVRARDMQQIFFYLIASARRSLSSRYPGQDPAKVLSVRTEVREESGLKVLRIFFVDHGGGDNKRKRSAPAFTGLGFDVEYCRQVVRRNGGDIAIEGEPEGGSTMVITFSLSGLELKTEGHHLMDS